MLLRNFASTFSNSIKKRLLPSGYSSYATNTAVLISAKGPNKKTRLEIISPFLNRSVKEMLDLDEIKEICKFLKPVDDFDNFYVFVSDEQIAENIVKQILRKTNNEKQILVEGNPGLGLITVNLLNFGVKEIHIFEHFILQKLPRYQILSKYHTAVTKKYGLRNHITRDFVLKMFKLSQVHKSSVKFVGTFTDCFFLRSLVLNFMNDYLVDENFEIYLVLSNDLYQSLKAYNSKRFKYIQYCVLNLFFYVEELASYPRSGFLPPSKKNNEIMYLVKITKNSNFSKNFKNTELKEYLIFISLLGGKKKLIIQTLEKWLPNCGLYLISKGVSMTNRIHDLSAQESFSLFKIFRNCKGYDDFRNSALALFQ